MSQLKRRVEEFRLYTGGRFSFLFPRSKHEKSPLVRIWIWAILLWLPLPIARFIADPAAFLQLDLWLQDLTNHVRLLIALPFLMYSAQVTDVRILNALKHFLTNNETDNERMDYALGKSTSARDSIWIYTFTALIVLLLFVDRLVGSMGLNHLPSFYEIWSLYICKTIVQTLVLVWLSRTLIWIYLLWSISKIDLPIFPAHPDGRGGLGFLNWVQTAYSWTTLGFAFFLVADLFGPLAGSNSEIIIQTLKLLGLFLLINLSFFLGPLFFFTPQLCRAKVRKRVDYEIYADHCAETFEGSRIYSHLKEKEGQKFALTEDISGICDLIRVDEQVRKMAVVLPDLETIRRFVFACTIPLLPVLFTKIPAEIWLKIVEKVLL